MKIFSLMAGMLLILGSCQNPAPQKHPTLPRASFQRVAPALLQEGQWGRQAATKYQRYLRWVKAQNLWKSIQALRSEGVFTNRYFAPQQ
jgi:hypothetical protein